MLLVDYLEEAADYLRQKTMKLQKLDAQYHRIYDRDILREIGLIKKEIKKKRSEVTNNLLINLEEFRALNKYFAELLAAFMEDEYIGKIISKKAWLLDFKQLPPQDAALRFKKLRDKRLQLRDAKKFLLQWVGTVEAKAFVATYPVLRGHLEGNMEKDEVIEVISNADRALRKEGWLLLISDALIRMPISMFLGQISKFKYAEMVAKTECDQAQGRGTVAEAKALRKLEKVQRKKEHYENVLTQVLLANPDHLRSLKKKTSWLSRDRPAALEKFAESIVPRKVKERAWLNEMEERLSLGKEEEVLEKSETESQGKPKEEPKKVTKEKKPKKKKEKPKKKAKEKKPKKKTKGKPRKKKRTEKGKN